MRRVTTLLAIAASAAFLVSACGRLRPGRNARDLPAAFAPIEWGAGQAQLPAGASSREGCATRLRDERDGTTLLLRRSENRQETSRERDAVVTHYRATGDYEVLTPGRYRVSAEQWLRVDCTTWRPVGPVPRTP